MVKGDTGVARNGLQDWYWQRVSAVLLAVLLPFPFVILMLLATGRMDQMALLDLLDNPFSRLAHSMLVIALLTHAYLGVKVVLEDYVHQAGWRVPLMATLSVGTFGFGLWWFAMIWAWNS